MSGEAPGRLIMARCHVCYSAVESVTVAHVRWAVSREGRAALLRRAMAGPSGMGLAGRSRRVVRVQPGPSGLVIEPRGASGCALPRRDGQSSNLKPLKWCHASPR